MRQKIKKIVFLVIVILLALLLFKYFYFKVITFEKSAHFNDGINQATNQPTVLLQPPIDKSADIVNSTEFPQDEGMHQNLQSEWWYFVAHLADEKNSANKFGLTLIFFKNPAEIIFGLADGVHRKNFSSVIKVDSYDILAENRLVIKKGEIFWAQKDVAQYQIHFKFEDKEIDLDLVSLKSPFVLFNNAEEFYYEQTKVALTGTLRLSPDNFYNIKGWGWIDHQGFKAAIAPWQSWRWSALQLDNNIEMAFGAEMAFRSGNFIDKADLYLYKNSGEKEIVSGQEYQIKDLQYWQDPETNIQYPIKWQLEIPSRNINLIVSSILPEQTINGGNGLYEGSYQVEGIFRGESVTGRAQLEYRP